MKSAARAGRRTESSGDNDAERHLYVVVTNDEDQYSIWRADRDIPLGWTALGTPAPRQECLDRVEQLWSDMRPRSLRQAMAGRA